MKNQPDIIEDFRCLTDDNGNALYLRPLLPLETDAVDRTMDAIFQHYQNDLRKAEEDLAAAKQTGDSEAIRQAENTASDLYDHLNADTAEACFLQGLILGARAGVEAFTRLSGDSGKMIAFFSDDRFCAKAVRDSLARKLYI